MSESTSGSRCYTTKPSQDSPPLIQNGHLVLQAHDIGWLISGICTVLSIVISAWLIYKHLRWYTNKLEQRYIIRLLFMVPIYATISFASYIFWNNATPILLVRDAYEAIVLTAFFYLLLMYLSPSTDEQRTIFASVGLSKEADRIAIANGEPIKKWMFPLSPMKWKPADGFYFLQLMKWGVLQYCVVRPITTLVAIILSYMGLYCEDSWGLGWGHIWITAILSLSVTIAMYCLVQLYIPIGPLLARHKPLLKLFSVKAVVFLTFWQATLLGVLSTFNIIHDSPYMTADDINIGWGALLECFEMVLFALLHIKAFPYQPYVTPGHFYPEKPTPVFKSLASAFDFRETLYEVWLGIIYLHDRMRGLEARDDILARRAVHHAQAFGRARPVPEQNVPLMDQKMEIMVERRVDVVVSQSDPNFNPAGYRLPLLKKRDNSEGLTASFRRELGKIGFGSSSKRHSDSGQVSSRSESQRNSRRSWFKGSYSRVSQIVDDELNVKERSTLASNDSPHQHPPDIQGALPRMPENVLEKIHEDLDDPPPPSRLRRPYESYHDEISDTYSQSTLDLNLFPMPPSAGHSQSRRSRTSRHSYLAQEESPGPASPPLSATKQQFTAPGSPLCTPSSSTSHPLWPTSSNAFPSDLAGAEPDRQMDNHVNPPVSARAQRVNKLPKPARPHHTPLKLSIPAPLAEIGHDHHRDAATLYASPSRPS